MYSTAGLSDGPRFRQITVRIFLLVKCFRLLLTSLCVWLESSQFE